MLRRVVLVRTDVCWNVSAHEDDKIRRAMNNVIINYR
jgi:hypothetical protein